MSAGRPIRAWRIVHRGTPASGNLKTWCGLDVSGHWQLVDGQPVTCPDCTPRPVIARAMFERKRVHDQAGYRGQGGMNPPDEHGDVWWTEYDPEHGTVLSYGWLEEEVSG